MPDQPYKLDGLPSDLMSSKVFDVRRLKTESSVVDTASGNALAIDSEGKARVVLGGRIDDNNSTFMPLLANATFTGLATETLDAAVIIMSVVANQASATDGFCIDFSADNVFWAGSDCFTIPANTGKVFTIPPVAKWYRIRYINGTTAQTFFQLQATLKYTNIKPSSHKINDNIVSEDDAELVKAVLSAEDENGSFVNIRSVQGQTGHNLKVSVDQVEPTTNSLKVIEYSHSELHSGTHYYSRGYATLGNGAVQNILVVTPNTTKWAHMVVQASGEDGAVIFEVFEGAVTSNNGTKDNERNRNRNFPDNNTTIVYYAPTIISNGVSLGASKFGSSNKSGGGGRDSEEVILKQNTKYIFRITNAITLANTINWVLDWYEHTNIEPPN